MSETQEKFLKVLESLVELAATKKNTLEYDEIVKAFDGMELSEEQMDSVYDYLEKKNIDVLQGKSMDDTAAIDDLIIETEDGILPADVRSQDVLTEDEKTYLSDRDVPLCKMDRLRVMEENLAIYRDMAHADELLYISCAATDQEGGAISPSPVYDTIKQMYTLKSFFNFFQFSSKSGCLIHHFKRNRDSWICILEIQKRFGN